MFHHFHGRRGHGHHHPGHREAMRGRMGWGPFEFGIEVERGGRGGGRRRQFDGEALRLILLKLLSEQARHGYDLIREIEARSGGFYVPSPGVVYPALTLLDDMGLIEEQKAEGAKKLFAITEAGAAHLAENAEQADALMARLGDMAEARARDQGGLPIRRAMGNLKAVLQNRFAAGDVDTETMHAIADLIDEAARKIERL
jgi:DNA-binding PadR family transcriptional regulator